MSSFSFNYPWILLLILLVIICGLKCKAKESALIFPHMDLLKIADRKKGFLIDFLKYSSIFLLIVSMAGPIKKEKIAIKNRGYDIAIALNSNGLKNFNRVKNATKEFIEKRENDNIALIVFDKFSYIASPLTSDKNSLKKILGFLQKGMVEEKNNILDGLTTGIKLLKNGESKSKILILLTNGVSSINKTSLMRVVELAKKYKIKIYSITMGDKKENLLKLASKATGGKYFFAKDIDFLKRVYGAINVLKKPKKTTYIFVKRVELYEYPLFIGVLTLLLYIYLYLKRGV